LESTLYTIESAIGEYAPNQYVPLLHVVDDLTDSIRDYFHDVEWKSTIPSEDEIRAKLE
jgi:hypothetical protein